MRPEILCLPAPEAGHLLPLLPVLRRLMQGGCGVRVLAPALHAQRLRAHGLTVENIDSAQTIPDGEVVYDAWETGRKTWKDEWDTLAVRQNSTRQECYRRRFQDLATSPGISLLLADRLFYAHAETILCGLPAGTPIIWVSASLPDPIRDHKLKGERALVLCPPEFASQECLSQFPDVIFAEPSIDRLREEAPFDDKQLRSGRRLVLCAFGSQTSRHPEIAHRLAVVRGAAALLPEFDFVIATGQRNDLGIEASRTDANVWELPRIPQLKLMSRCVVMLSHGGLGTIKEAIYEGVSSLCWPLCCDQFRNAAQVEARKAGYRLSTRITTQQLARCIQRAARATVTARLSKLQGCFRASEAKPQAARFIQEVISERQRSIHGSNSGIKLDSA